MFSILSTSIFLRPIVGVMRKTNGTVRIHSKGYKHMRQTAVQTLTGSTLAVLSSTALYMNLFIFSYDLDQYARSVWLNIFVFGINMDSICNDVGMVLASGILNDAAYALLSKPLFPIVSSSKDGTTVEKDADRFEFDSRAYDVD